jgi:hypothetical protein
MEEKLKIYLIGYKDTSFDIDYDVIISVAPSEWKAKELSNSPDIIRLDWSNYGTDSKTIEIPTDKEQAYIFNHGNE